jgi:hypothetical protein
MKCPHCQTETPIKDWPDWGDGMCAEGCCDVYKCPNCKRRVVVEVAD